MSQKMIDKKPIRVVLIDDHFQMHRIVQTALGATADIKLVGQGANGKEGLLLCEQYQPDIVLMDVVMPEMDGIEATKILNRAAHACHSNGRRSSRDGLVCRHTR